MRISLKPLFLAGLICLMHVDAMAQSVGATRTIRGKTLISAADLVLLTRTIPGGFSQVEQVAGMEARKILYPGQPILASDIGPPAIIERNQIVILYYSIGALNIKTEGRALARAGAGDRIRVMNLESRTTLTGVVTDSGRIRITP